MNIEKLIEILQKFPKEADVRLMCFDEHEQDYMARPIGSFRMTASSEGDILDVFMVEGEA